MNERNTHVWVRFAVNGYTNERVMSATLTYGLRIADNGYTRS